jgi:hypothetical protein
MSNTSTHEQSRVEQNIKGHSIRPNATLVGVDLNGANLTGANLTGANLTGANLTGVYLVEANLTGADLTGADLTGADLMEASLRGASLRGASLWDANLWRADLRDANLTGANLAGAEGVEGIPKQPVPGLARLVLKQIKDHPETWDQRVCHSGCGTKHCVAGWAIVLAGEAGVAAEKRLNTEEAAALLLGGNDHPFNPTDNPIPWLEQMVSKE